MRFGVATFVTDQGIGPAALGRALEERGFASLFLAEHTHIPVSRESPWPGGAELPDKYYRTLDPIVALTCAATATRRLTLGTGIALAVERDPILLAKEIASLDMVSEGRAVLGVGAGWNREEMRNHGTDPRTRMALLRDRVLAIKEIWTSERAEYHGDHVDFDPIFCWPKPVQRPHPPVLVGGSGPTVFDRVLEYGDGWMPIPGRGGAGGIADDVARLRRAAGERGRGHIPVTVFGAAPTAESVHDLVAAGVDEILLELPTLPEDATLRTLDELAGLVATVDR